MTGKRKRTRPPKWLPGEVLHWEEAASRLIYAREGVFHRDRYYAASWALGWHLNWFISQCEIGNIRSARQAALSAGGNNA